MNTLTRFILFAAVVFLLIGIALGVASLSQNPNPRPPGSPNTWPTAISFMGFGLVLITFVIWITYFADKAPDILRSFKHKVYEHEGLCFSLDIINDNGIAMLEVKYQSRYSKPCRAAIFMRYRASLGRGINKKIYRIDFPCPGGAFGIAHMPIEIPIEFQGKTHTFDVAADVFYPNGKGPRLRYRSGHLVKESKSLQSRNGIGNGCLLMVSLLFGGPLGILMFFLAHSAATFKIALPYDVDDSLAQTPQTSAEALWLPGDPDPDPDTSDFSDDNIFSAS